MKTSQRRRARRLIGWVAVVLLPIVLIVTQFWALPAAAQQRRTLFDMFFGAPRQYEPPPPMRRRQPPPLRRSVPSAPVQAPAPKAVSVPPLPPPVEKLENARKVLVAGDFVAGGLGEELATAFRDNAGVVVETRSNGSSGLVRTDYYDWQAQLPAIIAEVKPAALVIMLGANDRQQMTIADTKEKFGTDAWLAAYGERAAAFTKIATEQKIPVLWVGLPPFQSASLTADAAILNRVLRTETEKAGGEFIDIWDGFVDENGKFVVTGSDINGQQVRLRGTDGINFTSAGKRKLAFYVEKPLKRYLGDTVADPAVVRLDSGTLPDLLNIPPAQAAKVVRIPPISLFDPELDGGTDLLGAQPLPIAATPSARDLLVTKGELEPAPAGRIDDYRTSR